MVSSSIRRVVGHLCRRFAQEIHNGCKAKTPKKSRIPACRPFAPKKRRAFKVKSKSKGLPATRVVKKSARKVLFPVTEPKPSPICKPPSAPQRPARRAGDNNGQRTMIINMRRLFQGGED